MRILFIGAVEFSRRALNLLFELNADVVGVCTIEKSDFNSDHFNLQNICIEKKIPCIYIEDINSEDSLSWIRNKKPDVVFCFGWSRLIKKPLLNLIPKGVIGYHPAALPQNRGRHPLIWALALGLKKTASTFFFMDSGADSGDILSQRDVLIDETDDARTLYDKISESAMGQIREFLPLLKSGKYPRIPQNNSVSNTWRKRTKADGQIDWRMSADTIHNLIRALTSPYVGAHFLNCGNEYKIWKSQVIRKDIPENIEPGKVIGSIDGKPMIKCGRYALLLEDVEPAVELQVGLYL